MRCKSDDVGPAPQDVVFCCVAVHTFNGSGDVVRVDGALSHGSNAWRHAVVHVTKRRVNILAPLGQLSNPLSCSAPGVQPRPRCAAACKRRDVWGHREAHASRRATTRVQLFRVQRHCGQPASSSVPLLRTCGATVCVTWRDSHASWHVPYMGKGEGKGGGGAWSSISSLEVDTQAPPAQPPVAVSCTREHLAHVQRVPLWWHRPTNLPEFAVSSLSFSLTSPRPRTQGGCPQHGAGPSIMRLLANLHTTRHGSQ